MSPERVAVDVDGRRLTLSNLDKVLYPEAGFTKGQVIDYYSRIAPTLLPHIQDRPLTFRRYPGGVEGESFYAKNLPSHAPDWVRSVTLPSPGSSKGRETVTYPVICDLPTLVWAANLAALELHVPQWKVGPRGAPKGADLLVIDLDPGAPATVVECCRVAERLRTILRDDGLECWAKTSGSKGLQLYAPLAPVPAERTRDYARTLAERLHRESPDEVVASMAKAERGGKVLLDWSQNHPAKTTVAPYSLRARARPTVSTPVTWDEVAQCRRPEDLVFTSDQVLARVDRLGDLMEPLLTQRQRLPRG